MSDSTEQERQFIERLITLLRAKMERENPRQMHRDAHPKQHGLVKAGFHIEPNLPQPLQHGVFVPGARYDAWVRFSNQNAPPQNDNEKDIRGAAIKLVNVSGEKISLSDNNHTSQDFITISTPVFVTHDVKEFFYLIRALVKGKLRLLWFFLFHPRVLINLLKSNKNYYSPLETRYWSTTPYRLGPAQVVKYSLVPNAQPTPLPGKSELAKDPDFLRTHMQAQLDQSSYSFDFCVQLQKDPHKMPVEDPGKLWRESESPFIKVATVNIPAQEFNNEGQNRYGRDLSFNPWHSLPAHEPLGGINRARRVVYETLSRFRHDKNQVPQQEPLTTDLPPEYQTTTQN